MCITPDGLAVQVDTGMVDSQLDLGINTPVKDRIKISARRHMLAYKTRRIHD
jgi:hypothetical protein